MKDPYKLENLQRKKYNNEALDVFLEFQVLNCPNCKKNVIKNTIKDHLEICYKNEESLRHTISVMNNIDAQENRVDELNRASFRDLGNFDNKYNNNFLVNEENRVNELNRASYKDLEKLDSNVKVDLNYDDEFDNRLGYGNENGMCYEENGSDDSFLEEGVFIRPKKSKEKFEVKYMKERSKSQNDSGRKEIRRDRKSSFENLREKNVKKNNFGFGEKRIGGERPIKPMVQKNLEFYKNSEKKIKKKIFVKKNFEKKNIFFEEENFEDENQQLLIFNKNPDFEKKSFLSFKKKSLSRQNSIQKKFPFRKNSLKEKNLKIPKILKSENNFESEKKKKFQKF